MYRLPLPSHIIVQTNSATEVDVKHAQYNKINSNRGYMSFQLAGNDGGNV